MQSSLSIVMCTYNGAAFVKAQVQSILAQSYPFEELVIVDDASTDQTYALLQQLATTDTRIRLFHNPTNIGYNANFEKAIRLSVGDYIAFADQDDIWEKEKLALMMEAMQPSTALIYCDSVRFSDAIPTNPQPNKKNRRIEGTNPLLLAMFNTVSGHASIMRRSALMPLLPFPKDVYYDWWMALHATISGGIQFLPYIGVYQRMHNQNITIQQGLTEQEHRNNYRIMLSKHLDAFATIQGFPVSVNVFFEKFSTLWNRSLTKKFNGRLFVFLLQHHRPLFYYKVRRVPIISAFKVSFLFCFRW
jgi:glycosyltransferase involved in cell wall biosynthesis